MYRADREYEKRWMSTPEGKKLKKEISVRSQLKNMLIKYSLLPSKYPYNKTHEELMDLLKGKDFKYIRTYIKENRKLLTKVRKEERLKGIREKNNERNRINREKGNLSNRVEMLQDVGLLPMNMDELNEFQMGIYEEAKSNEKIFDIIENHINECNVKGKQKIIFRRLKVRIGHKYYRGKGKHMDIKEEDIVINEYCPFLGCKIDYSKGKFGVFTNNGYSIDRFDNSKGYVTNNVWVISRLANTIKLDSSIDELKTFCINILKNYEKKINQGL